MRKQNWFLGNRGFNKAVFYTFTGKYPSIFHETFNGYTSLKKNFVCPKVFQADIFGKITKSFEKPVDRVLEVFG